MTAQALSNPMTVIGLVNGMIGGIILVMPILALKTGTILIAPVTLTVGFFSYFSCLLCLRHLRNYPDLDQSVLRHFNNQRKYKIIYDVVVIISLSAILILYFGLICDMWKGMTAQSPLIPIINAIVLFPIVYIMKKFHFGASLLAYGILSIVGYCIFLAWMWIEAPKGEEAKESVVLANADFIELGAALAQGFAIQTFFIPILKQNPNRKLYKKLLFATYMMGIAVYSYIGYSGSQSIVNLTNQSDKTQAQEIGDFFGDKEWEVILLEIIYLVHLYSAFPEFLLIAKKRFFSIFGDEGSNEVTIKDIIYAGVTIFICLAIKMTSVSPQFLIQINGSLVSFFFIYLIPISLHIKCVYFTKTEDRLHRAPSDNIKSQEFQRKGQMENKNNIQGSQLEKERDNPITDKQPEKEEELQEDTNDRATINSQNSLNPHNADNEYNCCDISFRSKAHEGCQLAIIVMMLLTGLFTMGYTLYLMVKGE